MVDSTQKFQAESGGLTGALKPNSVLQGRYLILNVLGVGGMGSVYLARDMRFPNVERNVAVKEVLNVQTDPAAREQALKNFGREADVLASLSHPAIPKIYDYFASKDRAYLVMEYIEGRDLETYLHGVSEPLAPDVVRQWAIELCDVLNYLHTHQPNPIIFRDMKPSNVMLDKQQERVRLIDFGIAKPFQAGQGQKGTMIGTEGYSPPEQYKGEATPVSDIYALGATIHHLLTRRDPRSELPFTFQERSIHALNPKVTPEFEAIVMRALSLDRTARFQTVAEMKVALQALDHSTAPSALGNGPGIGPGNVLNGVPKIVGIGAGTPPPAVGIDRGAGSELFDEDSGIKPLWKFKVEDEIRSSPIFFRGIVYVGSYDNNLWGFNAADGKLKLKIHANEGIPGTPGISEEDNLLLFGSEDNALYALDLRTNKITWSFQTKGPVRASVMVAHGHAFVGSDDHSLYAVRLTNGRPDWSYDAGAPIRSRAAVGDDRIVFGTESGDVLGLDLQSGIKWRFKAKRAVSSALLISDNIAYFGSMDSHVYAVEVNNGWSVWRFRTGKAIASSPLIVDKMLYIGSADGFLYALDLNGREQWKFKTDGQIVSTPAFYNGALYFGSTDKKVYSIDVRKGRLRWEYETEAAITSSACIANNLVFIGSTDHHLYAFNA